MSDVERALREIPEERLGEWLRGRRWFGSKAQDLSHFAVLEVRSLSEDPELALAVLEARFQAGTHHLYQVLVGTRGGEEIEEGIYDALADPEEAAVLARLMRESAAVEPVHFHWTGALAPPSDQPAVRAMGAEQSNSSIVLDDRLVLKIFRRLEPGDNPELEMLRFLSQRGFPNIAALGGWYDFSGDHLQATLGVLQEFVSGRDGWEAALEAARDDDERFLEQLQELGEVTARMHTLLASDAADPDFAPEEPSSEALGLLTATIDEEIERAFFALDEGDERVAAIANRGEEVRDRLQMLSHQGSGGRIIRHHGDYHLGQTLLSDERGWVILDFEGEPARALNERRRKRSPLRDVAGMMRSFAYVASAAGLSETDWEERARASFMEGYLETVEPALLPAGEASINKLLSIFELEKAVYELRYEADNRPDWLPIPAAGLERLLEAPV